MTLFSLLRQACGLSPREAAGALGVGLSSVKQWDAGRSAPDGVLAELRGLHSVIRRASEEAFQAMSATPIGAEIEIGYPADDHEAQSLGLPCVGAWRAMCAGAIARLPHRVVLVPRGSTPATAAAMRGHGH